MVRTVGATRPIRSVLSQLVKTVMRRTPFRSRPTMTAGTALLTAVAGALVLGVTAGIGALLVLVVVTIAVPLLVTAGMSLRTTRGRVPPAGGTSGRAGPSGHRRGADTARLPVIAGMAAIPERAEALDQVVGSIIGQVDRLHVYLNGYDRVPACLESPKIVIHRSQEHGDLADNGKFFPLSMYSEGLYFTVDDDIVYPEDYVAEMSSSLKKLRYQGIVGVHGSYYRANTDSFLNREVVNYREALRSLRPVSVLGTGTAAFSIEHVAIGMDAFETTRMADIWFARHAKLRQIPMFVVARPEAWLRDVELPAGSPTIWASTRQDPGVATRALWEARPWGLDDITDRIDSTDLQSRLPRRWRDFRAYYDKMRVDGASAAVESSLSAGSSFGDHVAFYCDPHDVLATAEAALAVRGYRSNLFRRSILAATKHDPFRVGVLLERAFHDARQKRDDEAAEWAAARACRAYRAAGELESAERAIAAVGESSGRSQVVRSELVSLAIDNRHYSSATELLVTGAHLFRKDPLYSLGLATALTRSDSPEAAAPWLAELFGDAAFGTYQRRLISDLREFHPRPTEVSQQVSMRVLEHACAGGAADPVPLICLYLSLGEKAGARRLLEMVRPSLARYRPDHLAWIEAAVADDFCGVLGHINKILVSGGFSELLVADHEPGSLPLSRIRGNSFAQSGKWEPVSVVMTAHNGAATIAYAIESILNQTVEVCELIVVDDASTDSTRDVVTEYAASDPRVKLVSTDRNQGPYVCRNLAITEARGEYIAIQDSDDYAHPERISHQLNLLADRKGVACFTSHVRVADDGSLIPENNGQMVGSGPVTLLMRRQVVEDLGYFMPVRSRGDVEHRDRMCAYYGSHRVLCDDAVLLFARDSMQSNSRRMGGAVSGAAQIRRLKAEARRRRNLAAAREDNSLFVPADGIALSRGSRD